MKKFITISLLLCLAVFLLTACQNEEKKEKPISPSPTEQSSDNGNIGYKMNGNTLYVHGYNDTGLDYDTNEEGNQGIILGFTSEKNARKMVIGKDVHLLWYETEDSMDDNLLGSNIGNCPLLTEIIVEKGNDMLYSRDGILYKYGKGKENGIYACPPAKRGKLAIRGEEKLIWNCAFSGCQEITSVYIPKTIQGIGDAAFGNMANCQEILVSDKNPYYKSVDGILYTKDGKVLLAYPSGKRDKSFRIPKGVEHIASGAFVRADHLKKIILSDSISYIQALAFYACQKLTTVKSAKKIEYVDPRAFYMCPVKKKDQPKSITDDSWADELDWRKNYNYFGISKKNRLWISGILNS